MGFEFQDIPVYKLSKKFYWDMKLILREQRVDRIMCDQLTRAALSITLNIAEGYGRYHPKDKRNFYITARASVNECVACLDVVFVGNIPDTYLQRAEELGKMLTGLIKRFSVE